MVAVRSWTVVRRRGVWSAARCAARRYPAGWQAHGSLPLGVCDVGVERHLLPSERHRQYQSFWCCRQTSSFVVQTAITPLGIEPAMLLRWQVRLLLVDVRSTVPFLILFIFLCLLVAADECGQPPSQSVNWGRRLARSASRRPPVC